jgi:hypothetical protein
MANGEVLTAEVKLDWVESMEPKAKWTLEEVTNVINSRGINIPYTSAYVIMNMLYSDLKNSFGDGSTEESLNKYITATYDWYYDADIKHTKENKLFKYYYNVVK